MLMSLAPFPGAGVAGLDLEIEALALEVLPAPEHRPLGPVGAVFADLPGRLGVVLGVRQQFRDPQGVRERIVVGVSERPDLEQPDRWTPLVVDETEIADGIGISAVGLEVTDAQCDIERVAGEAGRAE